MKVYEEVINFIAAGTSPTSVVAFQPSEEARARVADLISRSKTTGLSPEEQAELDHYLQIAPLTPIGEVTARIFGFNSSERILERRTLIAVGRYPTGAARTRMIKP